MRVGIPDVWVSRLAQLLARSPPTKANRVQTMDFRKWESSRTVPLVGGFSRGSPIFPAPSFRPRPYIHFNHLVGSQDLAVKSRPNLFSHSPDWNATHNQTHDKGFNISEILISSSVDPVGDGMARVVYHSGEGSCTHGGDSGSIGSIGQSSMSAIGQSSMGGVGRDGGSHYWGGERGAGGGVSHSDAPPAAVLGSLQLGQVGGTGCHHLRCVGDGSRSHRQDSGANGQSIAGHAVAGTVSHVVGLHHLAVRSQVAVAADLVAEGVLRHRHTVSCGYSWGRARAGQHSKWYIPAQHCGSGRARRVRRRPGPARPGHDTGFGYPRLRREQRRRRRWEHGRPGPGRRWRSSPGDRHIPGPVRTPEDRGWSMREELQCRG
ncbi:hypothetical protein PR048_008711 [Dryococelus australis]|uniref:Uncharacterized protein n=1 Tax=Dryococelus australis TaxID=614101 RepID=A0ABQ9HXV9_9NEOP|nr:hypothetical protein PR048_008711 [Dryococelus australis]